MLPLPACHRKIWSGSGAATIRVHDGETGLPIATLQPVEGSVRSRRGVDTEFVTVLLPLSGGDGGDQVWCGFSTGQVGVWDGEAGVLSALLDVHGDSVEAMVAVNNTIWTGILVVVVVGVRVDLGE